MPPNRPERYCVEFIVHAELTGISSNWNPVWKNVW
jgi:hypothetical protein